MDLRNEPSGIASAVFDAAPVTVYDTGTSPLINRAVAQTIGAHSAAFVPLISGERVIAVLAVGWFFALGRRSGSKYRPAEPFPPGSQSFTAGDSPSATDSEKPYAAAGIPLAIGFPIVSMSGSSPYAAV